MAEKKREDTELVIDNFSEFSIEITELFENKGDTNESDTRNSDKQSGFDNFDNTNINHNNNNDDEKIIGLF